MAWRGWEVGMAGDQVKAIQDKLIRKFTWVRTSYPELKVTGVYDVHTGKAIAEFQMRAGLPVLLDENGYGIADWATQVRLGAITPAGPKPTLYTLSGTGVDMWSGYPAEVARAVEDLFYWQPVFYPAATFPMGPSVQAGIAELVRLIETRPGPFVLVGYSQGAIVTSKVWRDYINSGPLSHRRHDLFAAVTFGNPMREPGHTFPGGKDPGGRGIAPDHLTNTPIWWYDYAEPGDIYTCTPANKAGENMTAIYNLVQGHLIRGQHSLFEQLLEIIANPFEAVAVFEAISRGIGFVTTNPPTAPHIEYHIRQATPGVTYLQHAIGYLREAARRVA